jgi:hypothetical protein
VGGDVDGDDFVHEDLGVAMTAEDGTNGLGDVCRGKHGEGDLVEERLKDVVVTAVDHRDVDREPAKADGCAEAAEAAADDDDAGADVVEGFGEIAQRVSPLIT